MDSCEYMCYFRKGLLLRPGQLTSNMLNLTGHLPRNAWDGMLVVCGLWHCRRSSRLAYCFAHGSSGNWYALPLTLPIVRLAASNACRDFVNLPPTTNPTAGFTVFLAHLLLVPATGCGINPARSFGSAAAANDWNNQWIYWVWSTASSISQV